jgi:hypothetical protein
VKQQLYSKIQRWNLRQSLEVSFGSGKFMSRNGGTLALRCPNPLCASHNRKEKKKLEVHLPTGLYSCWVCDLKGVIRPNDRLLALSNHSDLRVWVDANSTHWKNWNFDSSVSWETLMRRTLLQDDLESDDLDEPGDLVDVGELPSTRLIELPHNHLAWRLWRERWRDRSSEEIVIAEAWRYDVRVQLGFTCRFAFPAWDEWGCLRGIHWWKPQEKIHYGNTGDKAQMVLAEHSIDWSSTIYLVEGVWDALKGGQNAVSLLGSTLPRDSRLKALLGRFRPSEVVIVLDPDAQEKAWQVASTIHSMGLCSRVVCPPGNNDPDEMNVPIENWLSEFGVPVQDYGWQERLSAKLASL